MPQRILITGVDGFIGNATASRALASGLDVTGLGKRKSNASLLSAGGRYLSADITDRATLQRQIGHCRFDYVINLAGSVHHGILADGGREAIDTHFNGAMNLIECCRHKDLAGFVQVGSSDEYGNLPAPQYEAAREQAISCYSLAKTATTHLVQMLARTEAFPGKVARLFLVYGPGQSAQRFVPQIIQGCLSGREFPVSAGDQLRDFTYVDDVADGLMALALESKTNGEIVNIGSGEGVSIKSMIERVLKLVGQGKPLFGEVPYRSGESMALYADISRMTRMTGWRPKVSLEKGLISTIEYYRQQVAT